MKRLVKLCFFTVMICLALPLSAKRPIKVKGIEGKCEITRHITLENAEKKALEDAKVNALRKAGVSEKIWSNTSLVKDQDNSEYKELLSQMISLRVDGVINVTEVKYSTKTIDNKFYAIAVIDASVKEGEPADLSFAVDVNGISSVYREGDSLAFDLKIYGSDAYVKLFWFTDNVGEITYPNQFEQNQIFRKETNYHFPLDCNLSYNMIKRDKSKEYEKISLFVIATKQNVPYMDKDVTFDSMLKWIFKIPISELASYRMVSIIK